MAQTSLLQTVDTDDHVPTQQRTKEKMQLLKTQNEPCKPTCSHHHGEDDGDERDTAEMLRFQRFHNQPRKSLASPTSYNTQQLCVPLETDVPHPAAQVFLHGQGLFCAPLNGLLILALFARQHSWLVLRAIPSATHTSLH